MTMRFSPVRIRDALQLRHTVSHDDDHVWRGHGQRCAATRARQTHARARRPLNAAVVRAEMCFHFLMYHPAVPGFTMCISGQGDGEFVLP